MIRQEQLFDFSEIENKLVTPKNPNISNKLGTEAETAFMFHAVKNGFTVFTPIGHAQSVDIVIQEPGFRPLSVQIKYAQHRPNGKYRIPLSKARPSYRSKFDNGKSFKKYNAGEFDIIAGYLEPLDSFWLAWLDDVCGITSKSVDPSACSLNDWQSFKHKL